MKNIIILLIALFFIAACSESWLDERPPHLITTETLYSNLSGFEAGLNGLYSLVRGEREGVTLSDNLRADIAMLGTDNMAPNARGGIGFIALTWDPRNVSTDTRLEGIFLWLYQVVNTANTIINQAENRTDVDWSGAGTDEENKN